MVKSWKLQGRAVAAVAAWALAWPAWASGPAAETGNAPGANRGLDGIRLASARALLRAGDLQRALKEAARAQELLAESPEIDVLLGDIWYRRADFEAAARYYTRATPEGDSGDRPWNNWDRTVPPGMESFVALCRVGHLALIPTRINGVSAGYFLLDTGAAYSSLSEEVTEFAAPLAQTSRIALAAVGREIGGSSLLGSVRFQFAGRELSDDAVAAFDFHPISNLHGVESRA